MDTSSEKRFLVQTFDKFNSRTDTSWKDPYANKTIGAKWSTWFWEMSSGYGEAKYSSYISLKLRYIQVPNFDSLVLDYKYFSKNWMFLRNGNIIINLDGGDNIVLKPHESDADVRDGGRIQENGLWSISKAELKKICDADSIEVRISGATSYFELKAKGLLKFRFMCRSFYSDLYGDNTYDDWVNTIIPVGSEGKSGCFIATATMGDYNHPIVIELRDFRDNWLLKRSWGIVFTKLYYKYSPTVASVIEKSSILKTVTFIAVVKPLQIITKLLK